MMPRGDWRDHRTTSAVTHEPCELYTFTAPGYFIVAETTQTVTKDIVFTPSCYHTPTAAATGTPINYTNNGSDNTTITITDPFFSSIIPMSIVLAASTTVAYVLLVFLFLCPPRARPILQKLACLMVVICLTVAITKTTTKLENEYNDSGGGKYTTEDGSAYTIRLEVGEGTFIRVGRIISDVFLWLAQVQTLIRLFPRHREKVVLKWAGYVLIMFDAIFAIIIFFTKRSQMENDDDDGQGDPFDAVPVLSYLFQIALALLYASCVLYYAIVKRRFAFYHPKRKNMPLLALLGSAAVSMPIIFFCLDISNKDLNAWVDYTRWVSAAAASVVVWEWVNWIEELERDARRDGVLGREIYDGDDGLDDNSTNFDPDDSRDETEATDEKGKLSVTTTAVSDGATHRRPFQHEEESYPPLPLSRSNTFASTTAGSNMQVASRDYTSSRSPPVQGGGFYMSRGAIPAESATASAVDEEDGSEHDSDDGHRGQRGTGPTVSEAPQQTSTAEKGGAFPALRAAPSKALSSLQGMLRRKSGDGSSRSPIKASGSSGQPSSLNAIGEKLQSIPSSIQSAFARLPRKQEAPQRILPVTFIPAPPRNLTMSLRELEEARQSGRPYPVGLYRTTSDEEDPRPAAIRTNAQPHPGPVQLPCPSSPVISRQGSLLIEERVPPRRHTGSSSATSNEYRSSTRSSNTPSSHGRHSTTPGNAPSTPSYFPPNATPSAPPVDMHSPSAPAYNTHPSPHPPPPDYTQADAARFQPYTDSVTPPSQHHTASTRSPTAAETPLPVTPSTQTPPVMPAAAAGRDLTPPPAAGNGIGRTVLEREVPEEEQ